ncbi:MAG: type II toxin-antitoxin system VapC family toxin [Nanoarchaeota archaeon]|nr:type II toxin-antitoxin system VapC family toxin [Nanoarchaeota archaeon]MBU1320757.1 type II toxin-antitoxin system VapC family toxin [Nanoarchaeota archaeon]MBU1597645.1 type II toxin-antitoxin system VapC family toxin [Nanoarchaeota archaeon]MBU2442182.1 type II toxin-antitoxin system VapC family toxin [Nanoarchaeota archaeon]
MFKKSILIDTNIIVDFLRGYPKSRNIFEKIEQNKIEASFSTITEAEIFSGKSCDSLEEQHKIDALLNLMKRLQVDKKTARKAGEIKRKYNTSIPDALIAATAISNNIKSIATKNKKHFSNIKEIIIEEPY